MMMMMMKYCEDTLSQWLEYCLLLCCGSKAVFTGCLSDAAAQRYPYRAQTWVSRVIVPVSTKAVAGL